MGKPHEPGGGMSKLVNDINLRSFTKGLTVDSVQCWIDRYHCSTFCDQKGVLCSVSEVIIS